MSVAALGVSDGVRCVSGGVRCVSDGVQSERARWVSDSVHSKWPVTRSVSLEGHSQLPGHYTDWSCYESDVKYTSNISPLNNHLSITT